jgi:hypothetical protein
MTESSQIREASLGEIALFFLKLGTIAFKSAVIAAALDGVVAGSLALMAVVAIQLGRSSIADRLTLIIFGVSMIALLRRA